ncbi:GldG family protein [Planctobacterium marinum]|uniref:ABC transporter n=1 Tax=Planctobacterium marinum TaxID=1631968 RepID=A0AA48KQA7_9ALTE|nr:hypothetical protein MACH26_30820 [Planctobacterium marinum]
MKFSNTVTYPLLAVLFFGLVLLSNQLFKSARIDLTENQVYSLSGGSKSILSEIDEPIELYFFFSDKASEGLTTIRNYADRVESLLQEYESASNGKIKLHLIDPEPFSEAEDLANDYGLTAASAGMGMDPIYLGLAGSNALDDEKIIPFFDPSKEQFLEYDLSQLIYELSDPEPVKVGLITGLSLTGGQNPMTGQFDPAWTIYEQIQQLYQLEDVDSSAQSLPEGLDVLLLIHPKGLSDEMLYAIDQFALNGGKILAFVDEHHESDPMAAMSGMAGANSSNINRLISAWGIEVDAEKVLLDAALGLDIRTQTGGITKHLGFVGLQAPGFDDEDVTTANLDSINGASFGVITLLPEATTTITPLLQSSEYAATGSSMAYAMTRDPEQLFGQFDQAQAAQHNLAVRLSGSAPSAFEGKPETAQSAAEHLSQTDKLNVIVVADTDMLTDRFWVNKSNFFGQMIASPFADNGAFVTNAIENLGGNNALISIRSRGTFARPFEKVDELTVKAEARFREQEQALEEQLAQTEQQLAELQTSGGEDGLLVLNEEQQAAIDSFMDKKIQIRKELREVRHQLDKDIESLGAQLKLINIIVAPLILVLAVFFLRRSFRLRGAA